MQTTKYKPQYAKQTYPKTPNSNQYAQPDKEKNQNYKRTTPSNQYKKKTVNKTINVNQQPRRIRWGLGGFRSMWHIPMIRTTQFFYTTVPRKRRRLTRTTDIEM